MEFKFGASVNLTLEYKEGWNKSKLKSAQLLLRVGDGLERKMYLDNEEMPTKEGTKVLSNALIQGLVGNIHYAHQYGFRDSAEHLRWVISELEKGFVNNVEFRQDYFEEL